MRKLLIALVVLAALFVAADRIAVATAENRVSSRLAAAYSLPSKPKVTIEGFPFLTQVLFGQYQRVDVSIGDVRADGYTLTRVRAHFSDVRASLSQVLGQAGASVTAAKANGSAQIGYGQIRSHLPAKVTLAPDGDRLKVSGVLRFHSVHVPVTAVVALSVTSAGIRVTPTSVTTPLGFGVPLGAASGALSFVIPVHSLPLHLTLTSVSVTPDGLRVAAAASGLHFAQP